MHIPSALLLTSLLSLFTPSATAALPVNDKSVMARTTWTITSFTRTCNSADTSCVYSFGINTYVGSPTPCSYDIVSSNAADASYGPITCGTFTISSSWSGQFGPGKGFSTLAVVSGGEVIYPSYTDTQLVNGQAVTPDQSYTPEPQG